MQLYLHIFKMHLKILKFCLFFLIVLAIPSAFAGLEDFQKDLNYANSLRGTVQEKGASFKPEETFKNYTPNPKQGDYYGGVTQSSDVAMQKDAQTWAVQDVAAKGVKDAFNTRPIYTVNPDAQEMQKSKIIEKDSYNISRGISDKYVDCTQAKTCKTIYVEKTCNEETRFVQKICTKTPEVTIIEVPYKEDENFSGSIPPMDNSSGNFVLPIAGMITNFSIIATSGNVWRCNRKYNSSLQGIYIGSDEGSCGDGLGVLRFHNYKMQVPVTINTPIKFSIQGFSEGRWRSANYNLIIQVTKYRREAHVTWQEVCKNV